MLWESPYLCYGSESLWRTSEQSSDRRVRNPKRSLGYLQRTWRSRSSHRRGCQARGRSGRSVRSHWGLLEGAQNRMYSQVSPELGDGQSPKIAEGIWGWSWKDSRCFWSGKQVVPWQSPPEEYLGSSDLKVYETFVTGILQWLKLHGLLGVKYTETQAQFLGTRLKGNASEWFTRNVERPNRPIRDCSLELVIKGLQKRFLNLLTSVKQVRHNWTKTEDCLRVNSRINQICCTNGAVSGWLFIQKATNSCPKTLFTKRGIMQRYHCRIQ